MNEQTSIQRASTKNILFVVGPDHTDSSFPFSEIIGSAATYLEDAGLNVTVIGEGNPSSVLNLGHVRKALECQPENAMILVSAHGKKDVEGHYCCYKIEGEKHHYFPTADLFGIIRDTDRKMNMAMLSCVAGIAHNDADSMLPKDSIFATLTTGDEDLMSVVEAFALLPENLHHAVENGAISFHKFLLNSLPFLPRFKSTASPTVTVAGKGSCPFEELLNSHLGNAFHIQERAHVRSWIANFDPFAEYILEKIEKNPVDVKLGTGNYDKALAVVLAASKGIVTPKKHLSL